MPINRLLCNEFVILELILKNKIELGELLLFSFVIFFAFSFGFNFLFHPASQY